MTPADLARIHGAAFRYERAWSAAEFTDLMNSPHSHLTPLSNGFALWRSVANEAELLTLAVDPAHQNRGIGKALMHTWMTQAADAADTAFLEVAADNGAACHLYAQFGFVTLATRPDYYARPGGAVDALVMRAALSFAPRLKT